MSDGKYLINKSSLTGIADAVRNKLGVGEATTDPQTGDIVYPEGKGYYTDTENVDYIAVSDYESNWSKGTWQKELVSFPSSETYVNYVEKPVSQVEIEGYFYWYSMTCKIIVNSQQISLENSKTLLQKVTCTFDTPKSYIRIWFQATNKYTREQFASVKGVKVLLKDENGNPIKLISSNFPVTKDGITCSVDTDTQEVQKPIPYSVADIKNNIKDYWNAPEGSLEITENGTYDVTNKASAVVNVPTGGGGGGTAERWFARQLGSGNGLCTLPTDLDTFEKFSTRIRAVQITNKYGAVLFKTDGTLCSYKDLNMDAPTVAYNAIPNSISNQDVIDAYNDDRIFVINTYDNQLQFYMGFKDNQIFFGYNHGNLGMNVGYVMLYYVYTEV